MKKLAIVLSCLVGMSMVAPGYALAAKNGGQAVINANGNVVRGDNVKRAKLVAQGVYYVFFNNNIRKCAAVATAGSHNKNALGPASITFWTRPRNNSTIEVFVYENENNSAVNTEFSLIVQC
ncbi:hypothetical protein [Microbaculum marinum]|uniref:Uncharacterized protein n=1 Tax=Microbaculum marinum TaxID=1764581 RepID=A0AAW9RKF1_9HYPH